MPGRPWQALDGPAGMLMVHVAAGAGSGTGVTSSPAPPASTPSAGASPQEIGRQGSNRASAVVLVHDFPLEVGGAESTGRSLPVLADRLAAESGWRVLAGCLRGIGESEGDFSLVGWLEDLGVLVEHALALAAGGGVWLVGFGAGGSVALCLAASDERVRGVGCLGSPATFSDWAQRPSSMLEAACRAGVVRTPGFPSDLVGWARQFVELRPTDAAVALQGREVLVVHGSEDDDVPVADARQLADAAGRGAELRVLAGAGHGLRADPRAIALLVGWLERQIP